MSVDTINPSFVAIITMLLTGLIFPFVLYYFKKNERLHEETKTRVGEHSVTLGLHEYRIISLEEWRRLQTPPHIPTQTSSIHN